MVTMYLIEAAMVFNLLPFIFKVELHLARQFKP